jgi:hypothetical protein
MGRAPISTILCPGMGTAVGKMPVGRCARQMRAAWDRVFGGTDAMHRSLRPAADDELDLLRREGDSAHIAVSTKHSARARVS